MTLLPGLEQDDVDISIENNTLVLRGERKRKREFEEKDAYRANHYMSMIGLGRPM